MITEYNQAVDTYIKKWQALLAGHKDISALAILPPIAIGWKTEDLAEFDQRCMALRDISDQIHYGWINERWLATFHLKDTALTQGINVIKLMQRRPGSTDKTGLDHLDFFSKDLAATRSLLANATDISWSSEKNGEHCKWLSIWFDDTEAKLRSDTVLDVCAAELLACRKEVQA